MLVQDLVTSALEATGHSKAPGRGPSGSQLARGLLTFNRMVDASNTSKALIFTEAINTFTTVANQQSYTWGPGGNWNAVRPQKIVQGNLLLPTSPVVRRPIGIKDRAWWGNVRLQQIYTYPEALYCDYANPQANCYLHPIPDAVYTVEFYAWLLNAAAASLTAQIYYPPGYEEFWLYNLAERLAIAQNLPVPPDVKDMARRSRAAVQRMNLKSPRTGSADYGMGGAGGGSGFNWMSGLPS
jgi:hypothetical protein